MLFLLKLGNELCISELILVFFFYISNANIASGKVIRIKTKRRKYHHFCLSLPLKDTRFVVDWRLFGDYWNLFLFFAILTRCRCCGVRQYPLRHWTSTKKNFSKFLYFNKMLYHPEKKEAASNLDFVRSAQLESPVFLTYFFFSKIKRIFKIHVFKEVIFGAW